MPRRKSRTSQKSPRQGRAARGQNWEEKGRRETAGALVCRERMPRPAPFISR